MNIKVFVETTTVLEFQECLSNFCKSINTYSKHNAEVSHSLEYEPCDVGIMIGTPKRKKTPAVLLRNSIGKNAKCFISVDTQLLGRGITPVRYHRTGINGILNDALWGQKLDVYPSDRFDSLELEKYGLRREEWKKGNKIIIPLQLPRDPSMKGVDPYEWSLDVVRELRKQGCTRNIQIRSHPFLGRTGSKSKKRRMEEFAKKFKSLKLKNVDLVRGETIPWKEHFEDTHCMISFTSGLSIDAILYGVPIITYDQANFAWDISSHRLEDVENLYYASDEEVKQFLYKMSYYQWTEEEMANGTTWKHLEPAIEKFMAS
jgi:hypothetical protein